tara:strand:+ start:1479 stop:1694 length:216 start_codon:yes stop_codon:yes gene_type:complete
MGKMINGHIIESNVPLPKGGVATIAEHMEVGDSVRVDTRTKANFIAAELRKLKRKGTSRKVKDGYRIWRIS